MLVQDSSQPTLQERVFLARRASKVLELRTRNQSCDCITSDLVPESLQFKYLTPRWIELHNGECHKLYC
jgi:hypothetical protein